MEKNTLRQVIIDQQDYFNKEDNLIERDIPLKRFLEGNEIVVITGIRRCGKSSLLKLISKKIKGIKVYINFEDVRLTDFSLQNFSDIKEIIDEMHGAKKQITYFFDEIQNVRFWEKWVNNLYSNDSKVFLTGSNSNLLSSEISSSLTGRNKVITLYPFSFKEYLRYKNIEHAEALTSDQKSIVLKSFREYLQIGGFPLIIKNGDFELSKQYFDDIVNKDIINRHGIRQRKELLDLALFLFSNAGKTYSYSTLKEITGIKSLSTIKNFIDFFKESYLFFSIGKFDYSIAKQKVSSSKVYAGDLIFLNTLSFNFSENIGQKLENLVFLELHRRKNIVFYHLEKKECDFVVFEGRKITQAIQVCANLDNYSTRKREIEGLQNAMGKYSLSEGIILTLESEEEIKLENKKILVIPIWKWLLQ